MAKNDKDVEREKLRLQFEKEAKSRESAQVMSSLLLQGATMTRKHCKTCGDPIFRREGEEFCPSCKGRGQVGTEENRGGQVEQNDHFSYQSVIFSDNSSKFSQNRKVFAFRVKTFCLEAPAAS